MSPGIRGTEAMDQAVSGGRRRWLWIAGGALAALVLVVALAGPRLGAWWSAERSLDASRLRIAEVVRGDLVRDFTAPGRVVAANHPRLFAPAAGRVDLRVRPGEEIRAGQVLAVIDSPALEAELDRESSTLRSLRSDLERQRIASRQRQVENAQESELRQVRFEAAERELERMETLHAQGLTNVAELERARDGVEVARLELRQAQDRAELEAKAAEFELADAAEQVERQELVVDELTRRVGELEVVAPFSGQVASLHVQESDAVAADQALLTVVDLSEYAVETGVPEAYADELAAGGRVALLYEGEELPGRIESVSPEVTAGQVEVRIAFDGAAPEGLRQNQRLSIRFLLERREDVLKLPRGPFLESGGGRRIYVVEGELALLREIRVGAVSVSEVEIVAGLEEGQPVALNDLDTFSGAERVHLRR